MPKIGPSALVGSLIALTGATLVSLSGVAQAASGNLSCDSIDYTVNCSVYPASNEMWLGHPQFNGQSSEYFRCGAGQRWSASVTYTNGAGVTETDTAAGPCTKDG